MGTVLGIDAAWTPGGPSGVALLTGRDDRWRCVAVASSYQAFVALAAGRLVDWTSRALTGSAPDVGALPRAGARRIRQHRLALVRSAPH